MRNRPLWYSINRLFHQDDVPRHWSQAAVLVLGQGLRQKHRFLLASQSFFIASNP